MKIIKLIIYLLSFICFNANSQDYEWWNVKHNWDGISPWTGYITLSSAGMGPNALPVPEIKTGNIIKYTDLELMGQYHFSKGDNTTNLFTSLMLPLFSSKVGFKVSIVPIEYYKTDTLTRDERRSRDYDAKGISRGDFYFSTYLQIIKDRQRFPDLLLTINIKTASGTNLGGARFTDTPGYFFDLSGGKDFNFSGQSLKTIRPYIMIGFYSWQTNRTDYLQDDALLYGAGFKLIFTKWEANATLGGYHGFINNGDRPIVSRLQLKARQDKKVNYNFSFQQGWNDYPYTTIGIGCNINLQNLVQKYITEN